MSAQLATTDLKTAAFKLFKAAMDSDPLRQWAGIVADVLRTEVASVTVFCPNQEAIANGTISSELHKWDLFRKQYQYCNPLRDYWQDAQHGQTVRMDQLFEPQPEAQRFLFRLRRGPGLRSWRLHVA